MVRAVHTIWIALSFKPQVMCDCNKSDDNKKLDYIIQRIDEMEKFLKGKSIKHNPDIMTVANAARYTQYSVNTLYNYVSLGRIPHIKQGHKVFFSKKALDNWMPQREKINPEK